MANLSNTELDANAIKEEAKTVDTTKKLKIGIIGTGGIANAHIDSYKRMPDVEIVAGADIVPGKAEEFFKYHGIEGVRCYNSHKELIDNEPDLDGVSICTYNRAHAECTIYALEHGINVLLEKPLCVTLEEGIEICRAERNPERFFLSASSRVLMPI